MRVLAFDPGYERLGVAVLEKQNGKEALLFSECFCTKKELAFSERLLLLGTEAERLIKRWKPDAVALEKVFFEKNKKTAMQVAEVRGALSYIAAARGIETRQYTPLEVKAAATGYGRAAKSEVALMVRRILRIPAGKKLDDELDAIAVGITCLANSRRY